MLGTEYNWLISHTQSNDGIPRVRMAGTGLITVMVAVFCVLTVALHAAAPRSRARSQPTNPMPVATHSAAQPVRTSQP